MHYILFISGYFFTLVSNNCPVAVKAVKFLIHLKPGTDPFLYGDFV